MNLNRCLAFLAAAGVLVGSVLIDFEYLRWVGFRDHYITDLERAEQRLVLVLTWLSGILALHLVWLGVRAGRRKVGRRLAIDLVIYLDMLAAAAAVDYYLRLHLDNGQGG